MPEEKRAPDVPHEGGSYMRQPDGTLKRAPPAEEGGLTGEAQGASPKPKGK